MSQYILHLSIDGIALDQSTDPKAPDAGWTRLGLVPLDSETFQDDLTQLRKTAGGKRSLNCYFALPMDQVKLIELASTGLNRTDVAEALIGQTPYDVADLRFDWTETDTTTLIAAVAQDTLDEAIEFTAPLGFTPKGFVAIPGGVWGSDFAFFGGKKAKSGTAAPPKLAYVRVDAPAPDVAPDMAPATPVVAVRAPDPVEGVAPIVAAPPVDAPKPKQPAVQPVKPIDPLAAAVGLSPLEEERPRKKWLIAGLILLVLLLVGALGLSNTVRGWLGSDGAQQEEAISVGNGNPLELGYASQPTQAKDVVPAYYAEAGRVHLQTPAVGAPAYLPKEIPLPEVLPTVFDGDQIIAMIAPNDPLSGRNLALENAMQSLFANLGRAENAPADQDGASLRRYVSTGVWTSPPVRPVSDGQSLSLNFTTASLDPSIDPAASALPPRLQRLAPSVESGVGPRFLPQPTVERTTDTPEVAAPDAPADDAPIDEIIIPTTNDTPAQLPYIIGRPAVLPPNRDGDAPVVADQIINLGRPDVIPPLREDLSAASPAVIAPIAPQTATPVDQTVEDETDLAQADPAQGVQEDSNATPITTVSEMDTGITQPSFSFIAGRPNIVPPVRGSDVTEIAPDPFAIVLGRPEIIPPVRAPSDAQETELAAVPLDVTEPSEEAEPLDAEAAEAGQPLAQPFALDDSPLARVRPLLRPDQLVKDPVWQIQTGQTAEAVARVKPQQRPRGLSLPQPEVEPEPEPPTVIASGPNPLANIRPQARPASLPKPRTQTAAEDDSGGSGSIFGGRAVVARSAEIAQPTANSRSSVTRSATAENVLNLRKINLIGINGTDRNRKALVRLPNGRFIKVGVGDRLDGGRVASIGQTELKYTKGGRNITLSLPKI